MELIALANQNNLLSWRFGTFDTSPWSNILRLTAMSLLRQLSRPRQFVCRQCARKQHTLARDERRKIRWAAEDPDAATRESEWEEKAGQIRAGMQQSMLAILEERGFVKDIAGYNQSTLVT